MGSEAATPTLIYLHIPKCAGSTMMGLLRANYGEGFYRVPNGGGWRRFRKLPQAKRARITCLTGHMPWGLGRYVPGACRYALLLRSPVERVASLYWFVRGFKKHRYHKQAAKMDLAHFVTSRAFADLDNGITRWLAGRRDVGSLKIRQELTDDDMQFAMTHLKASIVGFVHSFDLTIHKWAHEFGWGHTMYRRKMVQSYPGLTEKEKRIIREYNRFDMALYEYALRVAQ